MQVMTCINAFHQQFDSQKTQQPSSSLVGKSQNCIVSNTMSLVYIVFISCISFIGLKFMSLDFMGLFFHMYGLDLTTYGSNIISTHHPCSLNCQCHLVSHYGPIRSWRHYTSHIFYCI